MIMDKPNIVFVVIDALRPDHLSLFGYGKETDTNLKRIAKESVLFRNQFSVANATAPALTTIFSGLLPKTHGVIHQFPYNKPGEFENAEKIRFWLPSFLKEKGYETMAFDWIGYWFTKGFDYYKESEEEIEGLFPPTKMTVDMAISHIKNTKKPFLAFLHLWDTHFPFPNTQYKPSSTNEEQKILNDIKNEKQRAYIKGRMDKAKLYSVKDVTNKYDETIKIIDHEIGRLYDFLKAEKLLENTILIILGDHGDIIHEHGIYFCHCGLFDGSVKAPLIIKLPGIGAKETSEMVQNTDIVPTILDFIGEKIELDGKSLMPLIKEGKRVRDEVLLVDALANDVKAVRTYDKKLIIAKDNFCNLCKADHHYNTEEYNLKKDPNEEKNVFSGKSELMKYLHE
jgi:arylsulfatase A-like enzyme